jgi:hypothetical protein
MNRLLLWVGVIMLGSGLASAAQAQVTIGPYAAAQILRKYPYNDMPVFGISSSTTIVKKYLLSVEYQTFGSQYDAGSDLSTPLTTVLKWHSEGRTHQMIGGIHYQLRTPIPQPQLLLGLHVGYEWRTHQSELVEIPAGQELRTENFHGTTQRVLLFPSATLIKDWQRFEMFFQFRYGYSFLRSGARSYDKPRTAFAQLVVGMHWRLF